MRLIAITAVLVFSPLIVQAADYSQPIMNDPYGALRSRYGAPADFPPPASDPAAFDPGAAVSAPKSDFGGLYIGVNAGYGGDRNIYAVSAPTQSHQIGSASLTSSGFIGGGQVGYNYALGSSALVGVEADFSGSSIASAVSIAVDNATSASGGSRMDYLGTVRGRAGCVFGPVLIYATGGFAYADVTSHADLAGYGAGSASAMHEGYVVGAGFEYVLAPNVSLRSEYLRVLLDSRPIVNGSIRGVSYQLSERPYANVVRAGLNFHFAGWGGNPQPVPVVARY